MLQDWNIVSDDSAEYLVNCRLDWQRFLGMELGEKSPDSKTIWLFKEQLGKDGLRELFDLFNIRQALKTPRTTSARHLHLSISPKILGNTQSIARRFCANHTSKSGADLRHDGFIELAINLYAMGVVKREGSLVDATFVDVPKQRNTRDTRERTRKSNPARFPKNGERPKTPTSLRKKTQTRDGQRRETKRITVTKTM